MASQWSRELNWSRMGALLFPFAVYRRGIKVSVHTSKKEAEKAADWVNPMWGDGSVVGRKTQDTVRRD